jgi:hypothetical protein
MLSRYPLEPGTPLLLYFSLFYISAPLKLVLLGSDIKCCFRIGFKEGNEMVPTAFPFAATFILVVVNAAEAVNLSFTGEVVSMLGS